MNYFERFKKQFTAYSIWYTPFTYFVASIVVVGLNVASTVFSVDSCHQDAFPIDAWLFFTLMVLGNTIGLSILSFIFTPLTQWYNGKYGESTLKAILTLVGIITLTIWVIFVTAQFFCLI